MSAPVAKTVSDLCVTQNKAELGLWNPAPLDTASFTLTVASYQAGAMRVYTAQQQLRARLAALHGSRSDADVLQRLVAAEEALLTARYHFLHDVLAQYAPATTIDLNQTPTQLAQNYNTLLQAFVATGQKFLDAGLPACAAPTPTQAQGPGTFEATGATTTDRYTSACPTIHLTYTFQDMGPPETGNLTGHTGTVGTPLGQPYDGTGGPIGFTPLPQDTIIIHNGHYAIDTVTCDTGKSTVPVNHAGAEGVVSVAGTIGALRLGSSSLTEVQVSAGAPEATADGSFGVPGRPNYRALGYECSPDNNNGGRPLTSTNPAAFCRTVYYLDAASGLLEAFSTASTRFQTTNGTMVGMSADEAQQHEGRGVTNGCLHGIEYFDATPAALLIGITGSGSPPAPTDKVTDLALEVAGGATGGGGVGLLFC